MRRGAFVVASGALIACAPTIVRASGGLDLDAEPARPIRILLTSNHTGDPPSAGPRGFGYGGKSYRGTARVVDLGAGRSGIVAVMDVEEYLYGVLPIEASSGWPSAALEAQAIVARTYALGRRSLSRAYDVLAGDSDQQYGGVERETPMTNAAVEATRGMTVAYGGGAASVFYMACCGGHTADAAELWGHSPLPYLRGVTDPYCVPAPEYRWKRAVPMDRVLAAFRAPNSGTPDRFELDAPDSSGRPRTVAAVLGSGRLTVAATDFRRLVGADLIRSTLIRTIAIDSSQAPPLVIIEGSGRGHGVGMCQWGARYMAHDGFGADRIIAFYFPGTTIARG